MKKFHQLEIEDIYKETKDCVVITFNVPEDLCQEFNFKQGQYLTLKKEISGEDLRRSYSLCSNPYDHQWKVAVKQLEGGRFSTFANHDLKKGDLIEVLPPEGNFYVEIDPERSDDLVAFAAGSGITPILSIIKTHLSKESNSTFKLFYLNKAVESIIFREELEELISKYNDRLEVHHFLTQETLDDDLFCGRFSKEKIKRISSELFDIDKLGECFICGPEEMVFLIKEELISLGVDAKKIHFELFEVSLPEQDETNNDQEIVNNAEVTVIIDGEETTFKVPEGTSILEAAEDNDADVPYACKGGVCCTCKAKVLEGSVKMIVNYGLDDDDLENGMVLTCQSQPTSQKVVVDYDDIY
jgi:ring-1,2-phenylacetyl-CoA epoxidase subunit PaaE